VLGRYCARPLRHFKGVFYRFRDGPTTLTKAQKQAIAEVFEKLLPEFGRWLNELTPHNYYVHEVHLVRLRGLPSGPGIDDMITAIKAFNQELRRFRTATGMITRERSGIKNVTQAT
jgi:hypothetical protein